MSAPGQALRALWTLAVEAQTPGASELGFDEFASTCEQFCEQAFVDTRAADLVLVSACLHNKARALRYFAETFGPEIEKAALRLRKSDRGPDDVRQMLLDQILVGADGKEAKLAKYSGQGSLKNWVRAVAARSIIDLHRSGSAQRELSGDAGLFENLTDSSDPELQYLKRHYRDEFRRAFEQAVGTLDARDRNTLRHLFVERLTIDEVAALYSIHRSTAARRMASARDALLEQTRASLLANLGVDNTALDSIMRLIDSRFDVSVERVFSEGEAEAQDDVDAEAARKE